MDIFIFKSGETYAAETYNVHDQAIHLYQKNMEVDSWNLNPELSYKGSMLAHMLKSLGFSNMCCLKARVGHGLQTQADVCLCNQVEQHTKYYCNMVELVAQTKKYYLPIHISDYDRNWNLN